MKKNTDKKEKVQIDAKTLKQLSDNAKKILPNSIALFIVSPKEDEDGWCAAYVQFLKRFTELKSSITVFNLSEQTEVQFKGIEYVPAIVIDDKTLIQADDAFVWLSDIADKYSRADPFNPNSDSIAELAISINTFLNKKNNQSSQQNLTKDVKKEEPITETKQVKQSNESKQHIQGKDNAKLNKPVKPGEYLNPKERLQYFESLREKGVRKNEYENLDDFGASKDNMFAEAKKTWLQNGDITEEGAVLVNIGKRERGGGESSVSDNAVNKFLEDRPSKEELEAYFSKQ